MLTKLEVIYDRILIFLFIVAAALLMLMMLSVCTEVFFRYFLHRPQIWVVEGTEFGLLYTAFLGAAWVLRAEGHVKIDLVLTRLSPQNQALANIVSSILGATGCLLVVYYGAGVTLEAIQRGEMTTGFVEVPMSVLYGVVPLGSLLLSIEFLRKTRKYWASWSLLKQKKSGP